MPDEDIKVGDVVELKSGGVKMVVSDINDKGRWYCIGGIKPKGRLIIESLCQYPLYPK